MQEQAGRAAPADGGEYLLELVADVLQQLDPAVRGAFLQRFLKNLAGVDVSAAESVTHWEEVLRRRTELSERLGRPVNVHTAAVDYFSHTLLQNPILLEYEEFKRLRQNALTDPLTGLYNRRLFDEYAAKELNRSRRYGYPLTLLLLDLRNFKQANDSYGHAVGDEVLRCLAHACQENIRGSDYACRIGGDEFAVLMPQSEPQKASALAERVVEKFRAAIHDFAPAVDLDYGIGSYPADGDSPASLFMAADRSLYTYKNREKHLQPPEPRPDETGAASTPQGSASPAPTGLPPSGAPSGRRRFQRVALQNTDAYGVLSNTGRAKIARVLDLSFGGVSFLLDEGSHVPDTFHARLHVPLFPAAEFKLRRIYSQPLGQGLLRVGCSFGS